MIDLTPILDAVTFADPEVKEAMDGAGQFISHEELMDRLNAESKRND